MSRLLLALALVALVVSAHAVDSEAEAEVGKPKGKGKRRRGGDRPGEYMSVPGPVKPKIYPRSGSRYPTVMKPFVQPKQIPGSHVPAIPEEPCVCAHPLPSGNVNHCRRWKAAPLHKCVKRSDDGKTCLVYTPTQSPYKCPCVHASNRRVCLHYAPPGSKVVGGISDAQRAPRRYRNWQPPSASRRDTFEPVYASAVPEHDHRPRRWRRRFAPRRVDNRVVADVKGARPRSYQWVEYEPRQFAWVPTQPLPRRYGGRASSVPAIPAPRWWPRGAGTRGGDDFDDEELDFDDFADDEPLPGDDEWEIDIDELDLDGMTGEDYRLLPRELRELLQDVGLEPLAASLPVAGAGANGAPATAAAGASASFVPSQDAFNAVHRTGVFASDAVPAKPSPAKAANAAATKAAAAAAVRARVAALKAKAAIAAAKANAKATIRVVKRAKAASARARRQAARAPARRRRPARLYGSADDDAVHLPVSFPVSRTFEALPPTERVTARSLNSVTIKPAGGHAAPLPNLVESDVDIFTRTLWGEARGEEEEGQRAIAWVIVNRVREDRRGRRRFPNTLRSVCQQSRQFSVWESNNPQHAKMLQLPKSDPTYSKLRAIAAGVVNGILADNTFGSKFYYASSIVKPGWAKNMNCSVKIGRHYFCRDI